MARALYCTVLHSRLLCRVGRPSPGQSSERGAVVYHVSDLVPRCGLGIPMTRFSQVAFFDPCRVPPHSTPSKRRNLVLICSLSCCGADVPEILRFFLRVLGYQPEQRSTWPEPTYGTRATVCCWVPSRACMMWCDYALAFSRKKRRDVLQ